MPACFRAAVFGKEKRRSALLTCILPRIRILGFNTDLHFLFLERYQNVIYQSHATGEYRPVPNILFVAYSIRSEQQTEQCIFAFGRIVRTSKITMNTVCSKHQFGRFRRMFLLWAYICCGCSSRLHYSCQDTLPKSRRMGDRFVAIQFSAIYMQRNATQRSVITFRSVVVAQANSKTSSIVYVYVTPQGTGQSEPPPQPLQQFSVTASL